MYVNKIVKFHIQIKNAITSKHIGKKDRKIIIEVNINKSKIMTINTQQEKYQALKITCKKNK